MGRILGCSASGACRWLESSKHPRPVIDHCGTLSAVDSSGSGDFSCDVSGGASGVVVSGGGRAGGGDLVGA